MTARKTAQDIAPTTIVGLPDAWDSADVIELPGNDLVNKQDLLGVPFLITEFSFRANASGNEIVDITALDKSGQPFDFNDSSTGVRKQLIEFLESRDVRVVHGEIHAYRIACLKGLRISEYPVTDRNGAPVMEPGPKGKQRIGRTYYLALSGKKA